MPVYTGWPLKHSDLFDSYQMTQATLVKNVLGFSHRGLAKRSDDLSLFGSVAAI